MVRVKAISTQSSFELDGLEPGASVTGSTVGGGVGSDRGVVDCEIGGGVESAAVASDVESGSEGSLSLAEPPIFTIGRSGLEQKPMLEACLEPNSPLLLATSAPP